MNFVPWVRVKYLLSLIILLISSEIHCQPSEIDLIIKKIYNQEFGDIQPRINALKWRSVNIAQYLEVDYLWWNMISNFSTASETDFLSVLDKINTQNAANEEMKYFKLFYFIYQIRYENFKQRDLSKYISILKFYLYLDQVRNCKMKCPNSFMQSLFELIEESEIIAKYKFLIGNGFKSKENIEKFNSSLARIENMQNSDYASFDIIKQYYLGKIYLDVEKDYRKALNKFEILSNLCPGNMLFRKIVEDCKKKNSDESFSVLKNPEIFCKYLSYGIFIPVMRERATSLNYNSNDKSSEPNL